MIALTLRGLWARRRRFTGSFVAVFLGVSFLVGTLVLGDTLASSIDGFFGQAFGGTDVQVRSATSVSSESTTPRGAIPASVYTQLKTTPGVANAEAVVQGAGQLLGKNGKPLKVLGPRMAGNWITDPELNPYHLVAGTAPKATDDVVINRAVADLGKFKVGDTTAVLTPTRTSVRIVGIAKFGSQNGYGATSFTAFTLPTAQRLLLHSEQKITGVAIRAADGVSQNDLAARIRPVLPPGTEAITGKTLTKENSDAVSGAFLKYFRTFLLVFAGIALLVAAITIANAFSIVTAQRTRESALLRALGAERRQVLIPITVEAMTIGLVASCLAIGGGLGFATVLKLLFTGFGLGLPAEGLKLSAPTVVIALLVGTVTAGISAVYPAVRASRVPPLAALRDLAAEAPQVPRLRIIAGAIVGVLGAAAVIAAAITANGASAAIAGIASVFVIIAVILLSPIAARPVARLLGLVLSRSLTGDLAQRNAGRNPRRTAGAALALTVGVSVVTLLTVLSASLKQSTTNQVEASFAGDLSVSAGSGTGFSPDLVPAVAALPQVRSIAGLGTGEVRIGDAKRKVTVTDPAALGQVTTLQADAGALTDLDAGKLGVAADTADEQGWKVGSTVPVTFADGTGQSFTIGVIYHDSPVVGSVLIPTSAMSPHDPQATDTAALIRLRDGVSPAAAKAAITSVAAKYGATEVQDRAGYVKAQSSGMDRLLGIVYVMLALSILIALFGIANALSLAIHERIRELGLLRAVGATRGQIRAAIRWESMIVSVLGTVTGLLCGVFIGWGLVRALDGAGTGTGVFVAPPTTLVLILVAGALAGVLAAIRPARRAARLEILEAVAWA